MANALYPTFAFLGFVLVLIPLPWHFQASNSGTCLFMIWTALGCLIHFVNSIVWAGNLELHSVPWCDISTKLIVGLSVALPCASLCINRRLYMIARVSQIYTSVAEKRRGIYIDIAIGLGVPIIVMALHYIVQGHRFDIFEDIGCWPSTVNMAPSYPLVWIWPVVIGSISMLFCVLSLHAFLRRRKEFNELLSQNQNLNMNRYFRLMALATIEITTTIPFGIYFIYLNLSTEPVSPWVSWSDTKWHFSRIDRIPAWVINASPSLRLNFMLNLWLFPSCALLFFAFFGLAEEARRHYKSLYYRLFKPFGVSPPSKSRGTMKINVTLTSTHTSSFDETSGHGWKWDESSLYMPRDSLQIGAPSVADARVAALSFPEPVLEVSPVDASQSPQYGSAKESGDTNSFVTPTSTSPSTQLILPPSVPLFTVSPPEDEASPASRRSSHSPSRSISCRESIAADGNISVSSAYLPDPEAASRYHEEAFLTRCIADDQQTLPPAYPLRHDGIRMTIEKNVI